MSSFPRFAESVLTFPYTAESDMNMLKHGGCLADAPLAQRGPRPRARPEPHPTVHYTNTVRRPAIVVAHYKVL